MKSNENKAGLEIVISGEEGIKRLIEDLTTMRDLMKSINEMAASVDAYVNRHKDAEE